MEISHFTELQNLIEKAYLFNILATLRDSPNLRVGEQVSQRTAEASLTFDPNNSQAFPITRKRGRPVREHMLHFKDKQVSRM